MQREGVNPQPPLSAALDAALADPDPAHLSRWLHAAARGVSTYVEAARPWGEESWLPLHAAAEIGNGQAVAALLEAGAQPDARTRFTTPLHARQTAVHLAAAAGHAAVVAMLMDAGAEAEVRDARGRSPLWEAARGGHDAAVASLLEAGANPQAKDAGGRSVLHAALMPAGGDRPTTEALEVVTRLLNAGADPNAVCPREPAAYTPLLRAAALGTAAEGLIVLLRKAGAEANIAPPRD